MKTYSEKLLDPRWQRRRLEVLQRDGWKCQCCGNGSETLNVHHLVYTNGDPWEYPLEDLETLCSDCHQWRETFNATHNRSRCPSWLCYALVFWANREKRDWITGLEAFLLRLKKAVVNDQTKLADEIASEGLPKT